MQQLSDEQLKTFNQEYVDGRRWIPIQECIDRDFPDGRFTFLDVGGGNGVFADRLLEKYPESNGMVLDNSPWLLRQNTFNARKQTMLETVERLPYLPHKSYDLICFNWVLHHLVDRRSYAQTRENILRTLQAAGVLLTDRGRVSIFEVLYNGLVINGLPSWIIYRLTSAKSLARWARKAGANTAGVGVCFLSYTQWEATIGKTGLRLQDYTEVETWGFPWFWTPLLHLADIHCGHFWLNLEPRPALGPGPSPTL